MWQSFSNIRKSEGSRHLSDRAKNEKAELLPRGLEGYPKKLYGRVYFRDENAKGEAKVAEVGKSISVLAPEEGSPRILTR